MKKLSAEDLWASAYSLHYRDEDLETAAAAYKEILLRYPKSEHARWAEGQLNIIANLSDYDRAKISQRRAESQRQQKNTKEDSTSRQSSTNQKSTEDFAHVACISCHADLRIRLSDGLCRCPKCKAAYRISLVRQNPAVFFILPQTSTNSAPPPVPPAVKAAFAALGLDEAAGLKRAREVYRKLIQSYHPDKVTHLGPELRHVAEEKTKELNAAISTIEEFNRA